jgi:hypothetical protein
MDIKKSVKFTGVLMLLVAGSLLACAAIGGLCAIVAGSYSSVLSYLFV